METSSDLQRQIDAVIEDIKFIKVQLAACAPAGAMGAMARALLAPSTVHSSPRLDRLLRPKPNAGRPKKLQSLAADLKFLLACRSWIHRLWLDRRGEPVFAEGSGLDRLAKLGIVSAPGNPERRAGRPKGRAADQWLVVCVRHFMQRQGCSAEQALGDATAWINAAFRKDIRPSAGAWRKALSRVKSGR